MISPPFLSKTCIKAWWHPMQRKEQLLPQFMLRTKTHQWVLFEKCCAHVMIKICNSGERDERGVGGSDWWLRPTCFCQNVISHDAFKRCFQDLSALIRIAVLCESLFQTNSNCKVCISICMSHSLASECQISSNFFASLSEQDLLGAVLI